MPRKVYRRRRKKKYARKKRYMTPNSASGNLPLRKTLKSKFRYSEDIQLVSSASTPAVHVFSLNGLYDPNVTGIGHQPRGFDELMPLYDHYVVIGARVRVDFVNASTTNTAFVFLAVRDSNTVSTGYTDYLENGNNKHITMGVEGSGANNKTLYYNVNPNKFLGRSKPMADPQLKGSNASNPTEQAYLHIAAVSSDLFTATNMTILVTIEYTAVLIEPKPLGQS